MKDLHLPGLDSESPTKRFLGAIYYLILFILLVNIVTSLQDYKLITSEDKIAAFFEALLMFVTFSLPIPALILARKMKSRKAVIYIMTTVLFVSLCVLATYINENFHSTEYWSAIKYEREVNEKVEELKNNVSANP